MVGGSRRKSRSKLKKNVRKKGKISITKYIQQFKPGERVNIKAEPAVHRGLYHVRFHGKTGIIKAKKGKCYEVKIKDYNKEKILIIHPVHMEKA